MIYPRRNGACTANDAVFPFPFLGLPQIAALIPPRYRITIADEQISPVTGREEADLVFITCLTHTAYRGYALGDAFRKRGIPVVMGGIHVSVMPDEAGPHADSVVIGEAEPLVPRIITDFEKGELAAVYQGKQVANLDDIPIPETALLTRRHHFYLSAIQTSRGCPHDCDFCAVPGISGRTLRVKSLATVEKELLALQRLKSRTLFIVDDNFLIQKERCLAVMALIQKYGFRWMGFSNLSVSEDDAFLAALKDSGCMSLFIGFESLRANAGMNKNRLYAGSDAMGRAVSRIHARGIGIQGSFIFGFDSDTMDVFKETVSFIQENGIELPNLCIYTPFPGTPLYTAMKKDNRLLHQDWSKYDMNHAVFHPRHMTPQELQQGYAWALKYVSSPSSIISRLKQRGGPYMHFLVANFSLHFSQTRLARSMWNPSVQQAFQKRLSCPH